MEKLIQNIVKKAEELKDKYTDQKNIPVNYACIFCQSEEEYNNFLAEAYKLGKVIEERPNSLLFKIKPIETIAGKVQLLRIRKPDKTRPERGDADFTVSDYESFKEKYSKESGFSIIPRDNFEMIELYKKGENVRVYFSHPELTKRLNNLNVIL
ncbi:MAG: hypothetical protein WC662_03975 [Candidatus Paceibacterota bacterium]|jgi:hypothetical protein